MQNGFPRGLKGLPDVQRAKDAIARRVCRCVCVVRSTCTRLRMEMMPRTRSTHAECLQIHVGFAQSSGGAEIEDVCVKPKLRLKQAM